MRDKKKTRIADTSLQYGHIPSKISALAELRRTTGSLQAVLLALLHTRIAGEEASLLNRGTQLLVGLDQRAGDAVTDRGGLTVYAASIHLTKNIETTGGLGQGQGLTYGHLQRLYAKVVINIALVDSYIAFAGHQTHAGNGLLAPANGTVANLSH